MRANSRLSGTDRRTAILEAVLPLFAKKGFHGATTKELAESAGVSEALLYRHFPSKGLLYEEVQQHSSQVPDLDPVFERLWSTRPGAERLVAAVYVFIHRVANAEDPTVPRLMATSLLEDGRFVRMVLKRLMDRWLGLLSGALKAAQSAGEVDASAGDPSANVWLCQHLAMALLMMRLPGKPAVDYPASRESMVSASVLFCLRGIGLKEEAIRRHYAPEKLAALMG